MKASACHKLVSIGTAIFVLSTACHVGAQSYRAMAGSSASQAPRAAVLLYRPAVCPSTPIGAPKPGDILDWRLLTEDGEGDTTSLRRQVIRSVTGDTVAYDEILAMSDFEPFPVEARAVQLGFLPTEILEASVRYDGAYEAITALRPGESVSIPFHLSRSWSTKSAEAKVTLISCGVSAPVITGAPEEAVLVYRLIMPYSTTLNPDVLSETLDSEYVVSRVNGWPIADTTAAGTFILVPRTY